MSLEIPEQPVYLYDPETEKTYYFDGVIKIDHSVQLKIEDDPSNIKKKSEYVNNAKNEPDEVKIEIAMSNVYATTGDLPGHSGDRLKNAFAALDGLKQACKLLKVVTSLKTYSDMLIKVLQVTQAEGNADGWNGEITLHQMIQPAKKEKTYDNTSSDVDNGTADGNTPSGIEQLYAAITAKAQAASASWSGNSSQSVRGTYTEVKK